MEDLSRGRSSRTAPRNGCVLQELAAPGHGHWPLLTQALRWFENVHMQHPMKTKTTAERQTLNRKENRVGPLLALPYRVRLAITIRWEENKCPAYRTRRQCIFLNHTGQRHRSSFKSHSVKRRQNARMSFKASTWCCVMSCTVRSCSTA